MRVITASANLRRIAGHSGSLETQLLHGENFIVHSILDRGRWAYGHAELDGYAGFVETASLSDQLPPGDHRISVIRTTAYSDSSFKSEPNIQLPHMARVRVLHNGRNAMSGFKWTNVGWIFGEHLAPLKLYADDWVFEAERYLNCPYLWGGRDACRGVDCSGLVQNALLANGHVVPRNSGEQEQVVGEAVALTASRRRGDLVFWRGHVGIMIDAYTLLHATADLMQVVQEPLEEAVRRRKQNGGGEITSVRHVS